MRASCASLSEFVPGNARERASRVHGARGGLSPAHGWERELSSLVIPLRGSCELRAVEESDADELHALIEANRGHLARWLPWAAAQTHEHTVRFIRSAREQMAGDNGVQMAIIDEGRIVGMVGFHGIDWQHRATSLGYWLADNAQGRGTMTEAVRAMVTYALRACALNRVEIRASVENARSRALIERLGFRFEGVARKAFRLADGYHDDAVYSMLSCEWSG
jgi:ribosomal-protein-serine acetyltransferase